MITSNLSQDSAYFATILEGKDNGTTYWDLTLDDL